MRTLTLSVSCFPSEWDLDFDYFVVEIDKEYAKSLLHRIMILNEVRSADSDILEMYYWDYSGDSYAGDLEEHDPKKEPLRSDCKQLVVREDAVCWICYPKHGDGHITTDEINLAVLKEIASD